MVVHVRYILAALASLAYVAGSQWSMIHQPSSSWAAVVLLCPMLAVVGWWAWTAGQRLLGLFAMAVTVALLGMALAGSPMPTERLYLAQHVLVHLCLAAWFGSTLRTGMTPLIAVFAARVHRSLTPGMLAYMRKLTLVWTLYFVAMATVSLALHAGAPFKVWATFANLITPIALGSMFAGEYLMRYRWHPEFERVGILEAVRAYLQPDSAPATPPADKVVP